MWFNRTHKHLQEQISILSTEVYHQEQRILMLEKMDAGRTIHITGVTLDDEDRVQDCLDYDDVFGALVEAAGDESTMFDAAFLLVDQYGMKWDDDYLFEVRKYSQSVTYREAFTMVFGVPGSDDELFARALDAKHQVEVERERLANDEPLATLRAKLSGDGGVTAVMDAVSNPWLDVPTNDESNWHW